MSERNGDKSRFHRERKQKIARRQRTRELLVASANPKPARMPKTAGSKAVSA